MYTRDGELPQHSKIRTTMLHVARYTYVTRKNKCLHILYVLTMIKLIYILELRVKGDLRS